MKLSMLMRYLLSAVILLALTGCAGESDTVPVVLDEIIDVGTYEGIDRPDSEGPSDTVIVVPSDPVVVVPSDPVTPPDAQSPTTPGNLRIASGSLMSTSVQLIWDASTDNVAVAGYRVMRDNTEIATTSSTSFTDTPISEDADYRYTVIAFDAANNIAVSNALSVSTPATATTGVATLSWEPPTVNTDNSTLTDLSGYKIYYGVSPDSLSNTIVINGIGLATYVVENLDTNTTYYFSITAVTSFGVESDFSNIVDKTTS